MAQPPFELIRCSWPRPVEHADDCWTSEPEWETPAMPYRPQPYWEMVNGELCWLIDWREFFRAGLGVWDRNVSGEMRGFHVVFQVRVLRRGVLTFWDDDGSVVRGAGRILHDDRSAHAATRHEIPVEAGDVLDVAQWQLHGHWVWGAHIQEAVPAGDVRETLSSSLPCVEQRLAQPNGPPLKVYANGKAALRTVVSLYSLILRGYAPSEVWLFGEDQWTGEARDLFAAALPFAHVVPAVDLLRRIEGTGGVALAHLARRYWYVMKTCVALCYPPDVFCLMDDDVFILDDVGDALRAFEENDLVYMSDTDHTATYRALWGWLIGHQPALPTACFNAGLYWMRVFAEDSRRLAAAATRVHPGRTTSFAWEQGLIAHLYAHRRTLQLPTWRYFYPLFDGLPGGLLGYDFARNPCGFASIHFGGLEEKPSDAAMVYLAPSILGTGLPAPVRAERPA